MSGTSGTEVTITPRHVNHTDMENFEYLYFTDNSEETKLFRLTQLSWADSFYVSPDSLSWNAGETATKQVSLNSPGGWTAFTDTPGYNVSPSSGTGNATLNVWPVSPNTTGNVRNVVLYIQGEGVEAPKRTVIITHGAAGGSVYETAASDDVALTGYDPGVSIPCTRSVSPSGGMTYNVPIATASGLKNVPQLSLVYNSQGGEGLAGYGWDLSGLSAITVTNKTVYYDGGMYAADADSEYAVYSLDGVRLVPNSITNLSNTWQYETASGHVIVKKHTDAQGRALWFEAMYPNGSRATFGNSTATSPSVVYPVTLSRDRDGNWVRYSYASDPETDDLHLQRVEYGVAGYSQVQASIGLEYASRTDWHTRYMCGRTLGHSVMLKSVSSLNGADTLRKYTLVHEMREGANLLRRIRMTTPSTTAGQPAREAAPLRFGYGDTGFVSAIKLEGGRELFFEDVFSPDDELVYIRGKFVPGSYSDGVFIYAKPESANVHTVPYCYVPLLERTADVQTGEMDSRYEMLQAIDINGDGTDELVGIKLDVHFYEIHILVPDATGHLSIAKNVNINPYILNAIYQSGDYLGKGYSQLLALQNRGSSVYYRLMDISRNTLYYSEGFITPESSQDYGGVFSVDIDGDGITEVCEMTNLGLDIWRASSNGLFAKEKTITGITSSALNYGKEMLLTDLNSDGYTDIIVAPSKGYPDQWKAYYYDGSGFKAAYWQGPLRVASGKDMFMDVDHDGLPDLVSVKKERLCVFLNEKGKIGRTYMEIDAPGLTAEGLIPCNVARFGAASTLMMFDEDYVKEYKVNIPMPERRHLRRFTGSTNVRHETEYGYAAENAGYDPMPEYVPDADSGYFRMSFPGYVVRTDRTKISRTDPDSKRIESKMYSYAGATFNTRGLGFCGFRRMKTEDLLHPDTLTAVAVFNPEKRGVPVADSTFVGGTLIADRIYTYDSNYTTYGKLNPRLTQCVESDHLTGISVGNNYTYGSYDLPVMVATSRSVNGGDGTVGVTTTQYTNSINSYKYILGMPTTVTETKGLLASKTEVTLNESMLPTRTREYSGTVSGGNTQWYLVSDRIVLYDELGNVTSDKTAAYGATTYNETTYSYDVAGRYVCGSTDPMGCTIAYLNRDKYGMPTQVMDWLGRNVYCTNDAWGATTQKTGIDGTVETTSTAWSAQGEPGLYCVTKTVTGQPTTKVWYDALGTEVRSANQRFDGSWQYVSTEYDSRGRLYRTSLPYKNTATGPTLWNTYTYDAYDRPTNLTEATGRQTTWSYSGTSTTTTKEGMPSTSTTDEEGNVISVQDGGGTITYGLRSDGQPSSVTVTPNGTNQNIVTTFQYDVYGRRTAIVDPSAGTRTDAYTDNANGTSSVAHTGPRGTVTTNYDRYGRVTSVTRPEFSTTYVYGTTLNSSSYGKLLSETSTNGTSKVFTYDYFGRTATETEYADASNWLRKTYGYGAGSNIATVRYTTQDGDITTETFNYSNGHNTGISAALSQNTSVNVFNLCSENALGQPTYVTTGEAYRRYTYTTAGLPARRMITDVSDEDTQDLEYSYDPETGNMLWRKDNLLEMTENFCYDTLNRITCATQTLPVPIDSTEYRPYERGTIYATYNSKGNILTRGDVTMAYDSNVDPYKNTYSLIDMGQWDALHLGNIATGMTSFDRPSYIIDIDYNYASYVYNAEGEKVKSTQEIIGLNRVSLGGVYESDTSVDYGTVQRLFLGGTAYDAPMVLVKKENGSWTPYNIGRDVQGSITHVLNENGILVEAYYYDPWGNVVPMDGWYESTDSLVVEEWGGTSFYSKIIGSHGYTGHEIIPGLGIYNASARLYDPVTGRFLSPDPLVQDPASTQNFNRYAYCLNNPLKYTDESGEVISATAAILISAAVFGFGNLGAHAIRQDDLGHWNWAKYFFSGAVAGAVVGATWYYATPFIRAPFEAMAGSQSRICRLIGKQTLFNLKHAYSLMTGINFVGNLYNGIANDNGQWFNNFGKSVIGQFYLDENRTFMGQVWEGISRHTWEAFQQFFGYSWTSLRSPWNDRIDFFGGATFGTNFNIHKGPAATLGSYINIDSDESNSKINSYGSFDDYIMSTEYMADEYYTHEFGHIIQSKKWGVLYFAPALMSLWNCRSGARIDHDHYWTETYANSYSYYYFKKHFPSYAFSKTSKPCKY